MPHYSRSVTFWTAAVLVSIIVAMAASRFGWGQLTSIKAINQISDLPNSGANESQQIVCRGADPCTWTAEGQPLDGSSGWVFINTDTCGVDTPAAGTWSVDGTSGDFSDITKICFSKTTDAGSDASDSLISYEKGSSIYIQELTDATSSGVAVTSSNPLVFSTHVEYSIVTGIGPTATLQRVEQVFVLQFVGFTHSSINIDIRDAFLTALTAGGTDGQIIEWDTSTDPDEFKFVENCKERWWRFAQASSGDPTNNETTIAMDGDVDPLFAEDSFFSRTCGPTSEDCSLWSRVGGNEMRYQWDGAATLETLRVDFGFSGLHQLKRFFTIFVGAHASDPIGSGRIFAGQASFDRVIDDMSSSNFIQVQLQDHLVGDEIGFGGEFSKSGTFETKEGIWFQFTSVCHGLGS